MKVKLLTLLITLLFISSIYTIGLSETAFAYVAPGGEGGSAGMGFYLSPPQFNFSSIPVPSLPSINWSINPVTDFENLMGALIGWIAGFIGAVLTDGVLYIVEAVYYFFAYAEYYILLAAVDTSKGLGVWSLPVFVGMILLIGSLVMMVLKILPDALLIVGG